MLHSYMSPGESLGAFMGHLSLDENYLYINIYVYRILVVLKVNLMVLFLL